ncbi:HipA domain-containing protein [Nocardia sp. CA-290969]|uniref:HipA domain-containing protein n=1 Tax=Nocardia sp. CA-290969 TaxID=3239986 RepID=UPI003D8E46E4
MTVLDIWLNDVLVATVSPKARGKKVVVTYTEEGRSGYPPGAPILSCSLPALPGSAPPAASRAFLEGLLPEGRALEVAAARLNNVRLDSSKAPAAPADAIGLLSEYGRECAGAVIVMPAGERPSTNARPSTPLSASDLDGLLRDLPIRPLGADPEHNIRMSLGGAQDKLLLTRVDGQWCIPLDGYPSTHILKPTTVWPHSAENEALVMTLSRACGLSDSDVWIETIGGRSVFVTQRYDRVLDGTGKVVRLHQEDMCQAIGLRPKEKYDIGRPSERMARVLRENADSPRTEVQFLFEQVAFRAIVGDEDGHGKNYSLLLRNGSASVAPIYDSLCTLEYPDLTAEMATKIGRQGSLMKVDRTALLEESAAMGLPRRDAELTLEKLTSNLRQGIDDLPAGLTTGWPADRLIQRIASRAARLEAGQPMGAEEPRSPKRTNLDAATVKARRSAPLGP